MQSRVRQFMGLPLEIRLMIWKFALRPCDPAHPGVHFFSVTDSSKNGFDAAKLSTRCRRGRNEGCSSHHLAAPKFGSRKYRHSWTRKNPSAYTWDFGMWSACRESRHLIETYYKTESQAVHSSYSSISVLLISLGNNEKWRFFLRPEQDLICLQAFSPHTISWRPYDYHGQYICINNGASGLFARTRFSDHYVSLNNFHQVAILYDPNWNDIGNKPGAYSIRQLYDERSARGFFIRTLVTIDEAVRRRQSSTTLWLIDPNLERVRYSQKDRKGRKVFYGNGWVFTEVEKSLSRRSFSSGKYSSAFDFLDSLDILLGGDRPSHQMGEQIPGHWCSRCRNSHDNPRPYKMRQRVHVLMYEEST
ncbi:hypothetical protein V8C35DRAFT_330723 [Trichoderma chlorosporum]